MKNNEYDKPRHLEDYFTCNRDVKYDINKSESDDAENKYKINPEELEEDELGVGQIFANRPKEIWFDDFKGIKEDEGKIVYSELDWDYIDSMAKRMSKNRDKYPPKNWQKKMDIIKLTESAMRHARKILQTIDNDVETAEEHATALGCNGMMISYQIKNK